VVVLIAAVAAGVYLSTKSVTSTTSTTSSPSSSTSSPTVSTSSLTAVSSSSSLTSSSLVSSTTSSISSTSSSSSTSAERNQLVIDDAFWPGPADFNQLEAFYDLPYPNWNEYTVYQPLVDANLSAEFTTGTIQYLPDLADNWSVSANGTIYTFSLRQGVLFSNGDPLNAYQIWTEMYTDYYLTANSSGWLFGYQLFNMSNVVFGQSTIQMLTQSGLSNPSSSAMALMMNSSWPIYVVNPDEIAFHLVEPFDWFLGTIITNVGLIYDSQYVLENGGPGNATSVNIYFNDHVIPGTGPYTVNTISEDSYVIYAQNPNYWGRNLTASQIQGNPALDPGHVKSVVMYYKADDLDRYTDLSSGAAQIATIEASDWNLVLANPTQYGYLELPNDSGLMAGLALNTQLYPTNITAVRQAIVDAINYTDISVEAFDGQLSPMVGPEYPAWGQFYDLGNYTPYSYNLTEATQILVNAGITNLPPISFPVLSGCQFCLESAEVVQSDLALLNITVNLNVLLQPELYTMEFNPYVYENASQMGNLAEIGVPDWAPALLTPADNWIDLVSNSSVGGNFAVYSNPIVEKCVDSFTSTTNISLIQSLCKPAQSQIYSDAPYAWFGSLKLWLGDGSLVWNKNVVSGFYGDPMWTGYDTAPIFNTVTFTS
jgi:peptide/nickel transport system substrate-binding protein